MNPAKLDRRLTIQVIDKIRHSNGGTVDEVRTVGTYAAARVEEGGQYGIVTDRPAAERETVFEVRWYFDIQPGWRALVDGVTYNITRVDMVGRRVSQKLWCLRLPVTTEPAPR